MERDRRWIPLCMHITLWRHSNLAASDYSPSDVRTAELKWQRNDGKNTQIVRGKAVSSIEAAGTRRILFAGTVIAGERPRG